MRTTVVSLDSGAARRKAEALAEFMRARAAGG